MNKEGLVSLYFDCIQEVADFMNNPIDDWEVNDWLDTFEDESYHLMFMGYVVGKSFTNSELTEALGVDAEDLVVKEYSKRYGESN